MLKLSSHRDGFILSVLWASVAPAFDIRYSLFDIRYSRLNEDDIANTKELIQRRSSWPDITIITLK